MRFLGNDWPADWKLANWPKTVDIGASGESSTWRFRCVYLVAHLPAQEVSKAHHTGRRNGISPLGMPDSTVKLWLRVIALTTPASHRPIQCEKYPYPHTPTKKKEGATWSLTRYRHGQFHSDFLLQSCRDEIAACDRHDPCDVEDSEGHINLKWRRLLEEGQVHGLGMISCGHGCHGELCTCHCNISLVYANSILSFCLPLFICIIIIVIIIYIYTYNIYTFCYRLCCI